MRYPCYGVPIRMSSFGSSKLWTNNIFIGSLIYDVFFYFGLTPFTNDDGSIIRLKGLIAVLEIILFLFNLRKIRTT